MAKASNSLMLPIRQSEFLDYCFGTKLSPPLLHVGLDQSRALSSCLAPSTRRSNCGHTILSVAGTTDAVNNGRTGQFAQVTRRKNESP